ncbi:(S)-ureidoglycine aminohydrolase [Clostridiaceae bacterium 35-E11]
MGYPKDLLSTRAIIKHGKFAIIPPQGLVNNVVPGFEDCRISIVASPQIGASFVQYIIDIMPGGGTTQKFAAEEGIESFVYCVHGEGKVLVDNEQKLFKDGSYAYAPAGIGLEIRNDSNENMKVLLYKQCYEAIEGHKARVVFGNVHEIEERIYDDMENVFIKDLLPTDLGFDMNMHILTFEPGACHPFIETHVQEHGAYLLSGEGVYLLDDEWVTVKKEDYIWFGPYVPQGTYCVGRENLSYIYSKDCNRDVRL